MQTHGRWLERSCKSSRPYSASSRAPGTMGPSGKPRTKTIHQDAPRASDPGSCRCSDALTPTHSHGVLRSPHWGFAPGRCHPPALGDPVTATVNPSAQEASAQQEPGEDRKRGHPEVSPAAHHNLLPRARVHTERSTVKIERIDVGCCDGAPGGYTRQELPRFFWLSLTVSACRGF